MSINLYSKIVSSKANLTGIDLFSGAGGLSKGAEMAGIKPFVAVEYDAYTAETYRLNHPGVKVLQVDITKIDAKKIALKNPFILFGGPPCQGFSYSNKKTRNSKNPNNFLFKHYVRFVKELEPEWVLFENVEGFKNFEGGKVSEQLQEELYKLGYKMSCPSILSAADFGVPQVRNRYFLAGNRCGIKFCFPKPTIKRYITVKEAIGDLPSLNNGDKIGEADYAKEPENEFIKFMRLKSNKAIQNYVSTNTQNVIERYKYIKQGQNWKFIPDNLMQNYQDKNKCHSGIYRRLHPDKPSVVVANYRKSMLIHHTEDRGLSLREAARLQSFPDDFRFYGPLGSMQQQVGNAVPPLLAREIFKKILSYCM